MVDDDEECLEEFREPERDELVHALKAKWDTVNQKYQLMVRERWRWREREMEMEREREREREYRHAE